MYTFIKIIFVVLLNVSNLDSSHALYEGSRQDFLRIVSNPLMAVVYHPANEKKYHEYIEVLQAKRVELHRAAMIEYYHQYLNNSPLFKATFDPDNYYMCGICDKVVYGRDFKEHTDADFVSVWANFWSK